MPEPSRHAALLLVLALASWGCSCEPDEPEPTDGGTPTPADAAASDASTVTPVPGDGECAWEVGERPSADLPPVHDNEYTLELERWQIDNDGGDPVETRQRMNEGIAWAVDNGFDKVVVPPGRYVVGELTNDIYAAGIELPGQMTLELSDETVIEMTPNDRHNYCVISVGGNDDITIRGGQIRGDRAEHTYGETAHDEGHGVCVWTSANRVLIEDTELTELTGDGVLIVGSRGGDEEPEVPSTHVTIRNNEIHHNRRNGIAVVGGHNVVITGNHIHHIQGTAPQFGVDIEGAGRTDRDILIFQNNFHDNWGGDFVTSTGRNVWLEENTMTQCQVNEAGDYDASLPCETDPDEDRWEGQSDGPIVLWQNTDTVVLNNRIRMTSRSSNGLWGLIGYPNEREAVRDNDVGNFIAGNTFSDCGIHNSWNRLQFISNNTIHNSLMLLFRLECTRLEDNHVNRESGLRYQIRNVAGLAERNRFNRERESGYPTESNIDAHFPMSDDAPYRNSSPVFW